MHCVSIYPAPEEKLNLNIINTLRQKFKCDVGYEKAVMKDPYLPLYMLFLWGQQL